MIVEEKLIEREEELLNFILDKIEMLVQVFCQWKLTLWSLEFVRNKEIEQLNFYNQEFKKTLEYNTPLHFHTLYYSPLFTVINDCCTMINHQTNCYSKEVTNSSLCMPLITYKHLEENGFSKDFSSRVIRKLIEMGKIKRYRDIGGYIYTVNESTMNDILKDINLRKIAILLNQKGFYEDNELNFIFDEIEDDKLEEIFALQKEEVRKL
ncbi:MAG: hypothetical protein PVF17_00570 [Ignavibacteria bacterium]|jgi:hypothetical protein